MREFESSKGFALLRCSINRCIRRGGVRKGTSNKVYPKLHAWTYLLNNNDTPLFFYSGLLYVQLNMWSVSIKAL